MIVHHMTDGSVDHCLHICKSSQLYKQAASYSISLLSLSYLFELGAPTGQPIKDHPLTQSAKYKDGSVKRKREQLAPLIDREPERISSIS